MSSAFVFNILLMSVESKLKNAKRNSANKIALWSRYILGQPTFPQAIIKFSTYYGTDGSCSHQPASGVHLKRILFLSKTSHSTFFSDSLMSKYHKLIRTEHSLPSLFNQLRASEFCSVKSRNRKCLIL
jgi:hypothetical protein